MNYADFAFNDLYDFNTSYYEGDWSGIALRATGNAALQLYPDLTAEGYENTEMLARCSYFPRVIDAFKCEVESVRLLHLGRENSRASGL